MALFDFTAAEALPAGATLKRAAGPWSRTKYSADTFYDLTRGTLPPGIALVRAAGPYTSRGAAGLLVKGSAANTPRFDYDPPANGYSACRGLLLEQASTNMLFPSEQFDNPAWQKFGSPTVQADFGVAPDGTQTADRLVCPNGSAYNSTLRMTNIPSTGTAKRVAIIYMRSSGGGNQTVDINLTEPGVLDHHQEFTVGPTWTKCAVAVTFSNANSVSTFSIANGANGAALDVLIWGAGVYPYEDASYIPTTNAPVTRGVESITIALPAGVVVPVNGFYVVQTYSDGTSENIARYSDGNFIYLGPYLTEQRTLTGLQVVGLPTGLMETGTAADAPRFEHDPGTGQRLGLLVEPAATNYIVSDPASASAQNIGSVWAPNVSLAPDNTLTADKMVNQAGNGGHGFAPNFSPNRPAGPYTTSIFAAAAGLPRLGIRRYDGSTYFQRVTFDVAAGAVAALESGSASIAKAPLGSYRVSVSGTAVAATSKIDGLEAGPNGWTVQLNSIGDAAAGVSLAGLQVEDGLRATSFIPSAPAPATRNAETLTLDWSSRGIADGQYGVVYTFDDGSMESRLTAVAGGKSTVPTDLSRSVIAFAGITVTPAGRSVTLSDASGRSLTV